MDSNGAPSCEQWGKSHDRIELEVHWLDLVGVQGDSKLMDSGIINNHQPMPGVWTFLRPLLPVAFHGLV